MTSSPMADSMISVVSDLSRQMTANSRYQRLLDSMQGLFPCDAVALLQLRDTTLHPVAVSGLSDDTLGRTFVVEDQPRFARILLSHEPVRFEAGCELPDPYDGLIATADSPLHVHDCLGVALYIDERPWGLLTLDALTPGVFDTINPTELRTFIRLAEATIRVSTLIQSLQRQVVREHEVARLLAADMSRSELIGESPAIRGLIEELDVVARSDLAVLISGETGTGKELVARHLHAASSRADAPLVYVNCAALPENLVESELFGHTKGAFSGATGTRSGKFELADGGTLFLDEIGEMPLATQPKLLRALQAGEVQRVGSDRYHRVDVRVIAATNRDLKQEVASGRFRADLYHRLSVYPVLVPPLRERGRDILLLAGHFLELNRRNLGLGALRLDRSAREALLAHDWPGNVRELEHLISRAVLRLSATHRKPGKVLSLTAELLALPCDSTTPVLLSDVTEYQQRSPGTPSVLSLREATDQFQRELVCRVLRRKGYNRTACARELSVDPGNFTRLLKRLGVDVEEMKREV
ncbi:Functional role page for Anaerobic nitric oxide reductase transcription regulator NorR [Marinobacterium lacunae]|uniref:Functional role page for Anaerobic nitric oxide reductase transcription regulator NorR n=1 Tax=Marinobacterium lacunae TaxID=1232683 RepID=A0A081FVM5_9GAMM|nr:nitric oxide reductase transcriptional regulator NorR [Marinobacterium lacunae]KEA62580.1 Functional role page for Anaerobic nitric oxide reductase transcription regulator NorR [Marinobacterium lacunae]